jgi:4-hydroxybenzoate polyprenyltransferase
MAFTQYMVRWCLLIPVLKLNAHDLDYSLLNVQMSEFDFFLLVLATVMIGAAGYIINDYFDVRIDGVNRPDTNPVGKSVKRRVAMGAHMTINFIGVSLGIYLSWKYNFFRGGASLFVAVPALLWIYSTNLKRRFLIGNIVIALLSGIVPIIVGLFEIPNIKKSFPQFVNNGCLNLNDTSIFIALIALFAFVITLIREIIKDVEDFEGDFEYGCKTMPIVIGIARTKWILVTIIIVFAGFLTWIQQVEFISPPAKIVITAPESSNGEQIVATETLSKKVYSATIGCEQGVLLVPQHKSYVITFPDNSSSTVQSADVESNWSSAIYCILLIIFPLLYLAYRVLNAKGKADWHFCSILVKIIMVAGISFLFLYAHQIHGLIASDVS